MRAYVFIKPIGQGLGLFSTIKCVLILEKGYLNRKLTFSGIVIRV